MNESFKSYKAFQERQIRESQRKAAAEDHSTHGIIESRLLYEKGDPGRSFESDFRPLLPEGTGSLREYIESALAAKQGRAKLIELGGTGSRLVAGFTPSFFERSVGINLGDVRDRVDPVLLLEDADRNHSVIEGDIMSGETKQRVQEWLGEGEKADLIIERMHGGLSNLPEEPIILAQQANHWYQMLSEGGMLLAEIPYALRYYMPEWEEMIAEEYSDVLDLQVSTSSVLCLRKLPGAPEELPLLSPKGIIRDRREM